MDPNLFAIDGERLFEVLVAILVLSFFIERALALVFEHRWAVNHLSGKGLKEVLSFGAAFAVCRNWDFDAISVLLVKETTQVWGHAVTAAIIAGGSKVSIKFFHNVIGAMSIAERGRNRLIAATQDQAQSALGPRSVTPRPASDPRGPASHTEQPASHESSASQSEQAKVGGS